jgi:signal transduction histidine kinase
MSKPLAWLGDTLAKRLFWLMWVALIVSHLAAFLSVGFIYHRDDAVGPAGGLERLPPLPALPPIGGPTAPPGNGRGMPPPPPLAAAPPAALPWQAMALDYGIRLALIALAAWLGSRWLARPMARLVRASHQLGDALGRGQAPPQIDERRGTREVREAAQVFNRMARQLKEQFDARGLMISAISHDLRTPLTRMRMRLETGAAEAALRARCVADIREMDGLIDSVLELFRGQHANAPLQRTDVGALAQSLVDDLVEQGALVGVDGASAADAIAPADPLALRRVLANLIGNGLRYGTHVRVTVESDREAVRVLIDDDGPGIPPAQLDAVFEPFYRVETSRSRQSGGVGLGLFIANELMRRQGGDLRLSNRAAGGLRAEVGLRRG